jgi:hypothetical protein
MAATDVLPPPSSVLAAIDINDDALMSRITAASIERVRSAWAACVAIRSRRSADTSDVGGMASS